MLSSIVSPVPLSDYLEGILPFHSSDKVFHWSTSQLQMGLLNFGPGDGYGAPDSTMTSSSSKSEFDDFIRSIERLYSYKLINIAAKMQAIALIDLLREVGNANSTSAYGSLDEPGRRYVWIITTTIIHFYTTCLFFHFYVLLSEFSINSPTFYI